MTQRIAPNNNLPATHFIEHWKSTFGTYKIEPVKKVSSLGYHLSRTEMFGFTTIAIFRIRENKLPTLHKF